MKPGLLHAMESLTKSKLELDICGVCGVLSGL